LEVQLLAFITPLYVFIIFGILAKYCSKSDELF